MASQYHLNNDKYAVHQNESLHYCLRLSKLLALYCKSVPEYMEQTQPHLAPTQAQTNHRHDLQTAFDPGSLNSDEPNFFSSTNKPEIDDISAHGSRGTSKQKKGDRCSREGKKFGF